MTNLETNDTAATVAAQGAHVASQGTTSKKGATRKKGAPKGQKTAKQAKTKAATAGKGTKVRTKLTKAARKNEAATPRAASKGAKILALIARAKGATLAEIMTATDWQPHSVRGFVSTAGAKYGVGIESGKNEGGERVYRAGK